MSIIRLEIFLLLNQVFNNQLFHLFAELQDKLLSYVKLIAIMNAGKQIYLHSIHYLRFTCYIKLYVISVNVALKNNLKIQITNSIISIILCPILDRSTSTLNSPLVNCLHTIFNIHTDKKWLFFTYP